MRKKFFWMIVSFMMVLSLVLASCTAEEEEEEEEEEEVVVEEEEEEEEVVVEEEEEEEEYVNWWDRLGEPEYGGTLTVRASQLNVAFDPSEPMSDIFMMWCEGLFMYDWTVDPKIAPYRGEFVVEGYYAGLVAESWEQTDPKTITIHIRKGINWQNKPPANGREFTAEDAQYNYDRLLGTGSGFTEPNPFFASNMSHIERVVATDKHTVQFKLKTTSPFAIYQVTRSIGFIPPELLEQSGSPEVLQHWQNVIGLGPWILTEYVPSVSITCSRNPDYWGYDERYPQNQLPYMDKLKHLAIPDISTALAALRTGKIDIMNDQRGGPSWQQAQMLAKTNPEILQSFLPTEGFSINLRCDAKPFTDIRVRKALQMSIDRQTIAKIHYGGTVDGTPCGIVNPLDKDFAIPYDEWSEALQEEYGYNPTRAKELLAEAGYPDGFETNCIAANTDDIELLQIIKSYFMDVGVDMEIKLVDMATSRNLLYAGKNDQMDLGLFSGLIGGGTMPIYRRSQHEAGNTTHHNDPNYEAIYQKILVATDMAEAQKLIKEADMYAIEQHWAVNTFGITYPVVWQPWFKGYDGEKIVGPQYYARWWIDQDLKKSLGR